MKCVTLVSILLAMLLVEAVKGGLLDLGSCPKVSCTDGKKCVSFGLLRLCRLPGKKGAKCTNILDPKGFYEGFPPCEAGLTCPKEPTPKCQ